MAIHPCIKNLQDAVRKKEITSEKINNFKKWMNNPKKFKEEYKRKQNRFYLKQRNLCNQARVIGVTNNFSRKVSQAEKNLTTEENKSRRSI